MQARRHEVDVAGDRPALRLADLRREPHASEVSVRGVAHVVELDLVEAGPRGGDRDREIVVPRAAVPRVDPAEAGARLPDGAVRRLHGEIGPRDREDGILEGHDAADQVDAVTVREPRDAPRVVVRPGRADRAGELRRAVDEADLPALVLDVELERVQAGKLQVLLEPTRQRRQRLGHVDSAHLRRDVAPHRHDLRRRPGRSRRRRHGHRMGRLAAEREGPHPCSDRAGAQSRDAEPAAADLAAALLPPEPPELVRISTHRGGRNGIRCRRIAPWFCPTARSGG